MAKPEEIEIEKLSIKYKDIFNLEELYKLIYFWLRDHDWIDPIYKEPDSLVFETSYLQKDSASGVKEHTIIWDAEKIPHESAYFKFKLNIKFATLQIKELEVMHEGRKLKAHSGEITLEIKAIIILDYKGQWEENAFLKHFHKLWKKRVYKSTISEHKDMLKAQAEDLHGAVKRYLNLKGFLMEYEQVPFYPSRAYP